MPAETFKLTPEQQAIKNHPAGKHARILAGPGTGKSATLVALIDGLSKGHSIKVKLLTFTRAATGELSKKVSTNPAAAASQPSTVHSFAISVLLQNPGATDMPIPLRIADDWESRYVVLPTLARLIGVQKRKLTNLFAELAANFESLKEEEYPRIDTSDRARFLGGWQEHRNAFGYTLLAELPYGMMRALRDHPDLQGVDYDLLVVDEYQDLNACDLEVLRLISSRDCSIVGAGDDDQSIYSFRKAAPEGIRRFLSDYPGSADYPLSVTHRSGRQIVEWARFVIEGDPERQQGKPKLKASSFVPKDHVALLAFNGNSAEAKGIANITEILVERKSMQPSDVLILLRSDHNGSFSKPIKEALDDVGIPYSDPDEIKRILADPANRRLLATLRLLVDSNDSLAWGTLLELEHGIGATFIDSIFKQAREEGKRFGSVYLRAHEAGFPNIATALARRAGALIDSTNEWLQRNAPPDDAPQGWGCWITDTMSTGSSFSPSAELMEILLALDDLADQEQGLGSFLSQVMPFAKDRAQTESQGVRIMTMAASKGLTVEAVIVAGLENELLPRADVDPSEERRLLYVAMTRARRFLFGTWARRRTGPTARAGRASVLERRSLTRFLQSGPVPSQDGPAYVQKLRSDGES